jgi:hypothetical protein
MDKPFVTWIKSIGKAALLLQDHAKSQRQDWVTFRGPGKRATLTSQVNETDTRPLIYW